MGISFKRFVPCVDSRTARKVLDFVNAAETAEDIAGREPQEGPVYDRPGIGPGRRNPTPDYDIGLPVAQRIIDAGRAMGGFMSTSQIAAVPGVGEDKMRDLAYTVGPKRIRKATSQLSDAEWDILTGAFQTLIDSGEYQEIADIHTQMMFRMHGFTGPGGDEDGVDDAIGLQRFLPWHRAYLLAMEEALRGIDDSIMIPFWDWAHDREFPSQMLTVTNGVMRSIGSGIWLPTQLSINHLMARDTYTEFTMEFEEGPHGRVHVWVGGAMGALNTATNDPVFWLHHANVDRLWHYWQQCHPEERPDLSGNDEMEGAVMGPWDYTADDVQWTTDLDYTYTYYTPPPEPRGRLSG